jgi:hypothetical protein
VNPFLKTSPSLLVPSILNSQDGPFSAGMAFLTASSTGRDPIALSTAIKHLDGPGDTRSLQNGDLVEAFGHVFTWCNDCVTTAIVERSVQRMRNDAAHCPSYSWRFEADPLCDAALRDLFPNGLSSANGVDLFAQLEAFVDGSHPESDSAAVRFWKAVNEHPPDIIKASVEQINLARTVFLDHAVQIMQALLYYSLAGGFARYLQPLPLCGDLPFLQSPHCSYITSGLIFSSL